MKTLAALWQFISDHQVMVFYVFAVLVDKMPAATDQSSGVYKWIFGVLQVFAANWERGKRGVQGTLGK